MGSVKFTKIFVSIVLVFLCSCKPELVILSGGVGGLITDASSNNPVENATVKLSPADDSTFSSRQGRYDFIHIEQGEYQLQVTKDGYAKYSKTIFVAPAKGTQADVTLNESPVLRLSGRHLDLGFDTLVSLTISNGGIWNLGYNITSTKSWIKVHKSSGQIGENSDTIVISIDRAGLSREKHKESIIISSAVGDQIVRDTVFIYVNGVVDQRDMQFYGIVKIGTQIWMSENLNIGKMVIHGTDQTGSQIIEKYCYNDDPVGCNIYGGMYQWRSAMQNAPSDSGITGTTRGACPVGWHIPTVKEWDVLINYFGGFYNAGCSLIDTGTSHWDTPNDCATNISGFTALPAGYFLAPTIVEKGYFEDGTFTGFWSATIIPSEQPDRPLMTFGLSEQSAMWWLGWAIDDALSVRCVKDSETKGK